MNVLKLYSEKALTAILFCEIFSTLVISASKFAHQYADLTKIKVINQNVRHDLLVKAQTLLQA